jgi:hypothetical protein
VASSSIEFGEAPLFFSPQGSVITMRKICTIFCAVLCSVGSLLADEGMYPISEIHRLKLRETGLRIDAAELYNPNGISLIDAIVSLGGCSGSFVSPEGLIITNHHCVFGYVQAASSVQHDYVRDGFLARTRADELPARGATVRITDSYRDVSAEVLSVVSDTMSPGDRTRSVAAKIRSIVRKVEQENPGKSAEVAEMFPGKTYVLLISTTLRDLRLVYVPPRSIGEFGGENDNWVWPRHTGDFSFMRAYVAPDGSAAEYSTENIPYRPRKFLKVQPAGVDVEDPVFVLGYPGRSYRHRTSYYLSFEEHFRMPYVADLYEWQISVMEREGRAGRSIALKHDSRIKGLANTSKNYRGKLKGMRRLDLVARKREEESRLQEWIDADPVRRARYGSVLAATDSVYREMASTLMRDFALDYLRSSSTLLSTAMTILDAARERQKPDVQREVPYTDRNFKRTQESVKLSIRNFHEPTERAFLIEMLQRAEKLPSNLRVAELESIVSGGNQEAIEKYVDSALGNTALKNLAVVSKLLNQTADSLEGTSDSFLELARALSPAYKNLRDLRQEREGRLSRLAAHFVDAKQTFLQKDFIPDANGTLRFTYGRIRGFSPADATFYQPITTLTGVIQKTSGDEPYTSPAKLIELYQKRDFGRFAHKRLKDIPVGLLYNLDTVGGNSGSPLLNANGELVGVNFDRALEATINDFAWSEEYSRSIAVDIRYVLWVTEKIGGATHLLQEMGL